MAWVQYSQNLEDVMLRRAFQEIERGCYLDVGAYHPVYESNTYALYRRGWRGIAIDAQQELTPLWASHRGGDVFVCMAAGGQEDVVEFHCAPDMPPISTTNAAYAERYRTSGFNPISRRVRMAPVNSVLDLYLRGRELHLLTVDVEGGEHEVLVGIDFTRYRPWIVVAEATVPGSTVPSHTSWEPLVIEAGYEMVYFDGLNRFYVAREHRDLRRHFLVPPNVWDDYVCYRMLELEDKLSAAQARCAELERRVGGLPGSGII